jgi:hypothetical protein
MSTSAIPNIDPTVKHVGVSKLRDLNATKLKAQNQQTLVIQENDTPLAVLLSYKRFLEIKQEFDAMASTLELLTSDVEKKGILAAFEDIRAGRVRSFKDFEAELEKK